MLNTVYEFSLPLGFVDSDGTLHRSGIMRLSTALDELESMNDPRVRANPQYLGVLLLSRVIERLGGLRPVSPETVEHLFSADYAHLQDLFVRLNDAAPSQIETECPRCRHRFALDFGGAGAAPAAS